MKIKIFCIIISTFLIMPLITAEQLEIQSNEENIKNNYQNDYIQPAPHIGLSFVFFIGNAIVHDYNESAPKDITIQASKNKLNWFCLVNPTESGSAGGTFVVNIHDYIGVIRPQPITENDNINFIFVLAKDLIIMLP